MAKLELVVTGRIFRDSHTLLIRSHPALMLANRAWFVGWQNMQQA